MNPTTQPRAEFDLGQALSVLSKTPAVLRTWLEDLSDEWLDARDGPEGWNAREIVVHLIHGERTDWIPRARIILAQGASVRFVPFDRTANFDAAATTPVASLLETFATERAANLAALRGWKLGPDQLRLPGEHPELGRVTLAQLLATWVAHDLTHLTQVGRTMARRYRQDIGPWLVYFNTMK